MSWLNRVTTGRSQNFLEPSPPPPPPGPNPNWPGTPYAPDYDPLRGTNNLAGILAFVGSPARQYAAGRIPGQQAATASFQAAQVDRDREEALKRLIRMSQGTPGGTRTIDNSPAIRARFKEMRNRAAGRHDFAGQQLGQMYGQMQDAFRGLPEIAQQRFQIAQEAGSEQSARLIEAATSRINEEAASRAAQAAELGIEPMEMTKLNQEADHQSGQIAQTAANWGGMMGALSASEQTRGQVAYEGAVGMEAWAKQDLLTRYQNYLQMLDEAEQAELMGAIQMVSTPGTKGVPGLGGLIESLMMESFYKSGILEDPKLAGSFEEENIITRKNDVHRMHGTTDADLNQLTNAIMNGWNLQVFLRNGGNYQAISAAKALGMEIPSRFFSEWTLTTPPDGSGGGSGGGFSIPQGAWQLPGFRPPR